MESITNINLNMQAPNHAVVYATQGDVLTRKVCAALSDGATPWAIPVGAQALIRYMKPDGTWGAYDSLEDNSSAWSTSSPYTSVTITFAGQVLTVAGTVFCQIIFYNSSDEQLSTFSFRVEVQAAAVADEEIVSSDYFNVLTSVLAEMISIRDQAAAFVGSPLVAEFVSDMTNENKIYVYTGSETGYTAGHWYYYDNWAVPDPAWVDGGVYNSTALSTDTTLTIAGKAADAKATGDAIGNLKSALNNVSNPNLLKIAKTGYYLNASGEEISNATSAYSDYIKVTQGELCGVSFDTVASGVNYYLSVLGYNASKVFQSMVERFYISSSYVGLWEQTFTVPSGIDYIRVSFYAWTSTSNQYVVKMDNGQFITALDKVARIDANDALSVLPKLYAENAFDIADWENGGINASNGNSVGNSNRIRTKNFIPWTVTEITSTTSKNFMLYAWDKNGSYVGGWKNGAFTTDVSVFTTLDMTQFYKNPAYSGYQFKVSAYTAQVETVTGIVMKNLSLEKLFTSALILSHSHVTILADGTDFDSLTTAGNYLVENYTQLSSHSNTPPGVATGGRLFVYYDNSTSRPAQIWISFNGSHEPEIWIRQYVASWLKWCKISSGQSQPVNLRVLGYNIGAFNWGLDGGLSTNVDEKIANYKKFFGSVNPDIMLFAELSTNIDSNGSYTSDATLMSPLYRTRANFHQSAADTNLTNAKKVEGDGGVYLRNNNNDYAGSVGRLVCDIGNKKLLMSGGFLRVLSTAQDRIEAFQNYLTAIASYDYSIIFLDTNVQDDTERQSIYSAATSAGYTVCNGGYFGLHDTYLGTPTTPTTMYKQIDNIFVKGNIKVKNFYVASDEYDNLSSDHLPIVADLTLY